MFRKLPFLLLLLCLANLGFSQRNANLFGTITDEKGKTMPLVNISIVGTNIGTKTNDFGHYELKVPADSTFTLQFNSLGYESHKIELRLKPAEQKKISHQFTQSSFAIKQVEVNSDIDRRAGISKIDAKLLSSLPSASGNFEAILKTLPGVQSNNELSSQYNVRGGNFDENLVYVNDVEIYRPFLVRSGQQEGLSFINSDMVKSVSFSAGGFDAKYGDKLSSVLDITYKKPVAFAGSVSAGLLNQSINLEGTNRNRRLSYLLGYRKKSTKYVLGSLDIDGDYQPNFSDLQTYVNYSLSTDWELSFMGNFNSNNYIVKPQSRETTFGTFNEVLRLSIFFQGQEIDQYQSTLGALTATYNPSDSLKIKFIATKYNSFEQETFDIEGQYIFDEIESNFGKETFGQVKANRGVGAYLNHARNFLRANVQSIENKGRYVHKGNLLLWGLRYQNEQINDQLSEWNLIDSAGYALSNSAQMIELKDVIRTKIKLNTNRVNGFIQNSFSFNADKSLQLTTGIRATYWDYTKELNISPRITISYHPKWKQDWVFRASTGLYYQPPFYRELRNYDGTLSTNPAAQKSIHYVLAADKQFISFGGRKFKFISEMYYKQMDQIIPYEVDNVRIRYYANDKAKAYAKGIDFKVNGEFVKDLESWFSLSFMSTQEDIYNDKINIKNVSGLDSATIYPGYIPRPTDQRFNFSVFFQDNFKNDPSFKVHLNVVFGARLPFGPPDFARYKDTLRMPPYWRADIGFSKEFVSKKNGGTAQIGPFKSLMFYAEVFNLFKRSNTISYLWIRDVNAQQYAVPNYLTSRQINLRLVGKF